MRSIQSIRSMAGMTSVGAPGRKDVGIDEYTASRLGASEATGRGGEVVFPVGRSHEEPAEGRDLRLPLPFLKTEQYGFWPAVPRLRPKPRQRPASHPKLLRQAQTAPSHRDTLRQNRPQFPRRRPPYISPHLARLITCLNRQRDGIRRSAQEQDQADSSSDRTCSIASASSTGLTWKLSKPPRPSAGSCGRRVAGSWSARLPRPRGVGGWSRITKFTPAHQQVYILLPSSLLRSVW